jgi:phosphoribosyl-ATP pyrophosphohydrolase
MRNIFTDYERLVLEFHYKYHHHVQKVVGFPSDDVVELRKQLIKEEAEEFDIAIDLRDMEQVADSLADLLYVIYGTAISFGIPINEIFEEVHRSNMTKSMLKDEKSVKGKTIKGPDYTPPNLKYILFGQDKEVGEI